MKPSDEGSSVHSFRFSRAARTGTLLAVAACMACWVLGHALNLFTGTIDSIGSYLFRFAAFPGLYIIIVGSVLVMTPLFAPMKPWLRRLVFYGGWIVAADIILREFFHV